MKDKRNEFVFSRRIKAGKRTYFVDVKSTRKEDYFITITESTRKPDADNHYIKQKIFLYKEDFNKLQAALAEAIDYVKTELMPDYDFEKYDRPPSEQDESRYPQGRFEPPRNSYNEPPYNEPEDLE
jgi:hypothetical protein